LNDAKNILIVFWEGYLDVAPTLIELIRFLGSRGVHVTLAVPEQEKPLLEVRSSFSPERFSLVNVPVQEEASGIAEVLSDAPILRQVFHGRLTRAAEEKKLKAIRNFGEALGRTLRDEQYDVAFAVDATGLYALDHSRIRAEVFAYLSLEILAGNQRDRLKVTERHWMKEKLQWVIIQDEGRRKALEQSLGMSIPDHLFLPNSVTKSRGLPVESRYFHRLFGLDPDTRIILSAGMISDAVCSFDVARAIGSWRPAQRVKCVFHERMEIPEDRGYHQKLRAAGGENLLLSLKPVPYAEVDKVFASADIGLAIYNRKYGDNFSTIGAASGKLFRYMQFGVPVIVSDLTGLRELVEEHQIGLAVSSPAKIPAAAEKILQDHERYSRNARAAFEEKWNMDIHLDKLYQNIFAEAC